MADEDNRRLIPMSIRHLEDDLWEVSIDSAESYKVQGDFDSIRKACRRIKAKDGESHNKCRSSKCGTYASMISDTDTNEHHINVWKSKVPHTSADFKKLMENKIMTKKITLTKNYLIEGNIFKKGCVVEFKEAEADEGEIAFLPTDVWEKAKTIENEDERFEYVKSEVGDEFSDEEIKDFLNKNNASLEESKKAISKEDLDDMLMVIDETLKSEKIIDESLFDEVLKKAEKNKTLTDAWDALMNADEKSFNKKESKFWELFDTFCKEFKGKAKVA